MEKVGDTVFAQKFEDLECRAVVSSRDDEQTLLELSITQGDSLLWSRVSAELPEDDWAFGCWYDGPGVPCFFADLDGDKKPELMVPVPKADLDPTVYRIFRWDGEQLILLRRSALLQDKTGEFVWTAPEIDEESQIKWVDSIQGDVAQIVHRRRVTTSLRTLNLVPSKRGFAEAK